jgi:hypothetical protein
MFFNIGNNVSDRFPVQVEHTGMFIGLDPGWNITDKIIHKGLPGNECTIYLRENSIVVDPGPRRTFPVYYNETNVSNLVNYKSTYTSGQDLKVQNATILANTESTTFTKLDLNDTELLDYLYNYIDNKVKNFNPRLPIKVFPTGGVDVALIISFILKHKKDYELLNVEYKTMDYFTCHNRASIGNNWAYRDIHYWTTPSILMSGTLGDEMMLRNPQHAYMLAKLNGENIIETLKENPNLYHSHYYSRSKLKHFYDEADELNLNEEQTKNFILGRNSFDYQHWHMGETLTWTPLNDSTIANIMLNFSYSALREQFLDAGISKKLIARNNPEHLKLVSKLKNVDHFSHLYRLFEGIDTLS